jgi:hypothetical protein
MAVSELDFLLTLFFASLAVIGVTIWRTAISTMSKDRKMAVYIIVIIAPIVGVILYFIFRANARETQISKPM